jgi:tellurite resistance protein TehA-like permease
MGTGIVSVALASDARHTLSLILLVIASVAWAVLGLALARRAATDWSRVKREAGVPAALTGVAATAVLGARATGLGWGGVAALLLVIATALWLSLLPLVLGRLPARGDGASFMVTVSTQSLSVLAAQLALRAHDAWLLYSALALLCLGLVLYVFALARFDFGQLMAGSGDQWVSGGALAISTLAAARITLGARGLHELTAAAGALRTLTLVLWALSAVWLLALIASEALRRRLGYHIERWATVFPVGMYAACSFDAGRAAHAPGLTDYAQVWVWLAFALWLLVFGAMLRSAPPFTTRSTRGRFAAGAVGGSAPPGLRKRGTHSQSQPTSRP